jgi:hypothetical protein
VGSAIECLNDSRLVRAVTILFCYVFGTFMDMFADLYCALVIVLVKPLKPGKFSNQQGYCQYAPIDVQNE